MYKRQDPDRRYRLKPIIVGTAPSGLAPPAWWGGDFLVHDPAQSDAAQSDAAQSDAAGVGERPRGVGFPGSVFTGAVLARVGVAAPILHPDQAVLFRADGIDDRSG